MKTEKPKFGAHIFLWTSRWTNQQLFLIEQANKLGLDSIEIAVGDDIAFDARAIRQKTKEFDMDLVISPGGVWPMEADISHPNPQNRDFGLKWHKAWIKKGADAGAVAYTGALYAHPGRIEKKQPSKAEFNNAAKNLYELAKFAAEFDMKIVLEPMSHFRTHLVNTPGQAIELVKAAKHNNLFFLLDTYHVITEIRNYESGIRQMGDKLWCVHACENDRGVPGGGLVPWQSIIKVLKDINFSGYFVLETYNSSIDNGNFAYSRGMFHHVCDDGNKFVKQGVSFLKSLW